MMRRDVNAQIDFLRDASEKVFAAWVNWYPEWVKQLIAEKATEEPLFLLPSDEYAKKRRELETRADTALKQAGRGRDLAARLFRHVHNTPNKQINWAPKKLALELSSTSGGQRIKQKKVTEAADALVRVDVAAWLTRASGQHWALATTACDRQRSAQLQ
jgi:hypothetical protein